MDYFTYASGIINSFLYINSRLLGLKNRYVYVVGASSGVADASSEVADAPSEVADAIYMVVD